MTILVGALLFATGLCFGQSFTPLGSLGFPNSRGIPNAVSDDGSTVVGTEYNPGGGGNGAQHFAFYWMDNMGMTSISELERPSFLSPPSAAFSVSANGKTIVADALRYYGVGGYQSYLWTMDSSGVTTSTIPFRGTGSGNAARAISADGSTVAGNSILPNFVQVFLWKNGQLIALGNSGGPGNETHPRALSGNGEAMAAITYIPLDDSEATYFDTAGGNFLPMGSLVPGNVNPESDATDISADGQGIVGYSNAAGGRIKAFAWSPSKGMFPLRGAGGIWATEALAISANKEIVVGRIYKTTNPDVSHAIRWVCNHQSGLYQAQFLIYSLVTAGVNNLWGWQLLSATGVSADGSVIAGTGANPNSAGYTISEPWRAVLPHTPIPGNLSCL